VACLTCDANIPAMIVENAFSHCHVIISGIFTGQYHNNCTHHLLIHAPVVPIVASLTACCDHRSA